MKIQVDSLQIRIIEILRDWYPITVEELRDELSLPSGVLERSLKSLMVKGVIALEPLSDKTFIRLLTPEITVEAAPSKKKGRPRKRAPPERDDERDDSYMYT